MEGRGHGGVGADIGLVELENLLDNAAETQRKLRPSQSGASPPPSSPHRPNSNGQPRGEGRHHNDCAFLFVAAAVQCTFIVVFANLGQQRMVRCETSTLAWHS
jgi:hypothetical protein